MSIPLDAHGAIYLLPSCNIRCHRRFVSRNDVDRLTIRHLSRVHRRSPFHRRLRRDQFHGVGRCVRAEACSVRLVAEWRRRRCMRSVSQPKPVHYARLCYIMLQKSLGPRDYGKSTLLLRAFLESCWAVNF